MSYYPTRRKVETSQAVLELMFQHAQRGEPVTIPVTGADAVHKRHYQLLEVLRSVEAFPDVFAGRYLSLVPLVDIKLSYAPPALLVSFSGEPLQVSIHDLLEAQLARLDATSGDALILKFPETLPPDENLLAEGVASRGWTVDLDKIYDKGEIWYSTRRDLEGAAQEAAPSPLAGFGFGKRRPPSSDDAT